MTNANQVGKIDLTMAFKDALLKEMRRAGLTKSGLAAAVEVDKGAVTRWTSGAAEPNRRSFARLIKILPRLKKAFDD